MAKYLQFILIAFFAVGAILSLAGLRSELVDESIVASLEELSAFELSSSPAKLVELSDSAPRLLSTRSIHSRIGSRAMQASAKARTFEEQQEFYCTALVEYEKAIKEHPRNGGYLIAWANIRQILGDVDCPGSTGPKDYTAAVKQAVELEPLEEDVLYSAGLIYLWNDDKDAALANFKRMLEISTGVPKERWDVIAKQITQPGDIEKTIPPRFPQISNWSSYLLRSGSVELSIPMLQELGKLQREALKDVEARISDYEIPSDIYESYLYALLDSAADDQIRREIDERLIPIVHPREREKREFLEARVNTQGLEIVRTYLANDSRPQKGVFLTWASDDLVYLDNFHASYGFFLADKQSVKLIELRSRKQPKRDMENLVKVYVSNDNVQWTEIAASVGEPIKMLNYWALPVQVDGGSYQFFKIHYQSSARTKTFVNSFSSSIFAYGNSARMGQ